MNKKGFTLIELLAVIVILGIITTIVITIVTDSINSSKDESVVELAKNYAESARVMKSNDSLYYEPKNNEATIIPYEQITGTEISNKDKTAYGNIIPSYCFVGIVNNNNKYSYYINQVDQGSRILNGADYNNVSKDDIIVGAEQVTSNDLKELVPPYSTFSISYNNSNYNIKALGVKFNAKYKQNSSNYFRTSFDLKDQNIKFKGKLTLYNWTSSNREMKLSLESNQIGELSNTTYTFKKTTSGALGIWTAVDDSNRTLHLYGKELKVNIKAMDSYYVSFDLLLDNEIIYSGVNSSIYVPLYGYFTNDSSYALTNYAVKGNISLYDGFATTGVFPNTNTKEVSVDGIDYVVDSGDVLYLVVKK